MPRSSRAPGKRPRAWTDDWVMCPQPALDELIREMEKPLHEAIGFIGALKLAGEVLSQRGDDDCAVLGVSEAVLKRLYAMQETWLDLLQMAQGRGKTNGTP